jgi:hypothetical protein
VPIGHGGKSFRNGTRSQSFTLFARNAPETIDNSKRVLLPSFTNALGQFAGHLNRLFLMLGLSKHSALILDMIAVTMVGRK